MASPSYGIDVVALAFAVVLATTVVLLASQLMPDLERDTLELGLRSTGEDARR